MARPGFARRYPVYRDYWAGSTLAQPRTGAIRVPHYCSGCPHNTSTRVPEGSRALAGIGCHYMALWLNPGQTQTFSQMGGEGVPWVGQAPFTETKHVFANLGDGTYSHSGLLAIRQAIVAKVSTTMGQSGADFEKRDADGTSDALSHQCARSAICMLDDACRGRYVPE